MTLEDLTYRTFDELVEICLTDPEHIAIAGPTVAQLVAQAYGNAVDWITEATAQAADALDQFRTQEDAR